MTSIRPMRLNHFNVVLQHFDESVEHFSALFGAEFMVDMPQREMRAGLIAIGRVIFELFVPHEFLLNARYGPHYVGVEYQADMIEVRAAIASHGIRIVRDIGIALHTHPADCFGIAFEFYDGSFHDREWQLLGGPIKSAESWQSEHALGLTGLKGYVVAVRDGNAATRFLKAFLGAQIIYEDSRPSIAARAIGMQVADAVVELLAPSGDGALQLQLNRSGEGIHSTVFGVRDIEQAKSYFLDHGIALEEGSASDRLAVPARSNLGLVFEFAEDRRRC